MKHLKTLLVLSMGLIISSCTKKDVQIESQKKSDKLQVGKEISYDLSRDGYLFLDSLLANGNSLEFNKQLKVNGHFEQHNRFFEIVKR